MKWKRIVKQRHSEIVPRTENFHRPQYRSKYVPLATRQTIANPPIHTYFRNELWYRLIWRYKLIIFGGLNGTLPQISGFLAYQCNAACIHKSWYHQTKRFFCTPEVCEHQKTILFCLNRNIHDNQNGKQSMIAMYTRNFLHCLRFCLALASTSYMVRAAEETASTFTVAFCMYSQISWSAK